METTIKQEARELEINIEELEEKTAPTGGGDTVLPLPIRCLKEH